MPVLDTSAGFANGDEIRLMDALKVPISEANISGIITCMNQLTGFSPATVTLVLEYLTRYDTATTAQQTADVANTESKTLVKADVLEWEVKNGLVGLDNEIADCVNGLMNCFAFCPYVVSSNTTGGPTMLLRSWCNAPETACYCHCT